MIPYFTAEIQERIVAGNEKLKRGIVWCHVCGHSEKVDSAQALAKGWPMHCGQTMSIDSPTERGAR